MNGRCDWTVVAPTNRDPQCPRPTYKTAGGFDHCVRHYRDHCAEFELPYEVKRVLASVTDRRRRELTLELARAQAEAIVASELRGWTRAQVLEHRRGGHALMLHRQYLIWRIRHETALSTVQIGRLFGGRDHTTVLAACRAYEKRMAGAVAA